MLLVGGSVLPSSPSPLPLSPCSPSALRPSLPLPCPGSVCCLLHCNHTAVRNGPLPRWEAGHSLPSSPPSRRAGASRTLCLSPSLSLLSSPLSPRPSGPSAVCYTTITLQSENASSPLNRQEGGALAPLSLTGGTPLSRTLCLALALSSLSLLGLGTLPRRLLWVPPQRLARSSPRTAHRTGVVCPPRGTPAHFRASPPARRPGSRLEAVSGTRPEVAWARARARRAAS